MKIMMSNNTRASTFYDIYVMLYFVICMGYTSLAYNLIDLKQQCVKQVARAPKMIALVVLGLVVIVIVGGLFFVRFVSVKLVVVV